MFKTLSLPFFTPETNFAAKHKKAVTRSAVSPIAFWIGLALVVINAAMLVSYLSGVNSRSLQGYEIKQLQNKISQLSDATKSLNLKVAEASSILSIQNDFVNSNFVSMGTPKFLEVDNNHLTRR
jgi:hypothetical protein